MPELQKKFGLLVRYGCFESFDAIAAALGRKPKTVRWWGHGDAARDGGRVPANRYERVLGLLMECLVRHVPEHRAREIALGSASGMEEQLRVGDPRSIRDFIEREGNTSAGQVIIREIQDCGLVETDEERPAVRCQVPLDSWFRIVIANDIRRRSIVALQLTSSVCGIVPHTVEAGTGHVLLPGLTADGRVAHMRERRDNGVNRFAVIVVSRPLPTDIPSCGGQALTEALQDKLGSFYAQQPRHEREIHLVTVDIRKPG